jgi:prepilin-type N-terminal cleavage/methylation domain-containing protein
MKVERRKSVKRQAEKGRKGFTLIELLVVMTIIAVLVSLVASATMRIIGVQQEKATETVTHKIGSALDKHWKAVIAAANQESFDNDAIFPLQVITPLKSLAAGDEQRMRVLWIKLRLKQEFPMSFSEIVNPVPNWLPAKATYRAAIPTDQTRWPSLEEQNSACLLLAVSAARGGIITNLEDFGANAISTAYDPVSRTIAYKILVDTWNKPIVFCRWPTANQEVDNSNPAKTGITATKFRDSEDPTGKLLDAAWNNANWNTFENGWQLHSIRKNNAPYAYYTTPVVWSAGPDRKYGFTTFDYAHLRNMALDDLGATYDNIYSYRLRIGGN